MAQSANELEQVYHQIPSELRQRWRASYERYMAEQPKPEPEQEQSKSWLALLGEAQLMEAEARLAMGKKVAEDIAKAGEEIWSGIKKSGNSFAEIGSDYWNGLRVRDNKKFDSVYDFFNWLAVGKLDEIAEGFEGHETRINKRYDSIYDYVNYLSLGKAESLKGAFNPDDPLSKEHWMSCFNVFTLFGGKRGTTGGGPTLPKVNVPEKTSVPNVVERNNKPKYGVVPKGGGSTVNWGQATTVIKESLEAFQKSAEQLSKNKLAYDGPNANYKSSTQKPLEPTKNQIEVRKYYPGSNPENSASGSTSGKNKNSSGEGTSQALKIPQGLTKEQFEKVSAMIREKVGHLSDDIVVQGSRAKGTAKPTSDIDFAIRVSPEKFDELIKDSFSKVKPPNPGSAKEKTMLHAIETGKIQSGEAKLSKFREQLQQELGMDVDISIIKIGGPFDNPPFTPIK
ncbi:nucleotidyltransferase domain-containing protein [Paenibacillus dendritiformis]|uniref:nucleotidyltransferase domain-containing protein n=1 Tax=Paenibacillus dendritiformis TaxID=130049 RepID=UPI0030B8C464